MRARVDSFVPQQLLDAQNILGLVVFHRGFPMPQRMELNLQEARVLKFLRERALYSAIA